ncbi:citrate synthase [Lactococcus chungangensis CAU 28 = DSM 22330]|uniref:Citrate synthase n=1 Tax=Pseudolactococcus chungangensis CAU 28 = DSM 22330 TaxID=1122154 RepID=A0A1K2H3W0_9LACT|nr:citrate/2-methylcitrate synthase [Lactococcus chungangensis]PCS04331.1 citrate synthase [Lactococcus chungangensis CAU 28 = DSM 22330]SFZ70311.1 citrate synthase [Lactococcus chungangensis CAU 28 = DSM 22330]
MNKYTEKIKKNSIIPLDFYQQYDVKKGLRDVNGKGVLAGLTNISAIHSFDDNGDPMAGILEYRAINIKDISEHLKAENRFGFEEITYLLLFGELPTLEELTTFTQELAAKRQLPKDFVRDIILEATSCDIMNSISRSILSLATFDSKASEMTLENVLDQSLCLIANFPLLAIYAYQAYNHYENGKSLYIHYPDENLTTAQNILRLLRPDKQFSDIEAKVLDLALILHMEHGGGNNSTFTTHVVTSSGTDTYASVVASLSSLKGSKHGGANIQVAKMLDNIWENISDPSDEAEISEYLRRILNKEAFDRQGLIYGMGHAIYSVSDPRAEVLKSYVKELAEEKGLHDEYNFYKKIERLAPQVIAQERNMYKGVSANVDFYSGFVYQMLGLPEELYTPLFAIARIVGWSAHRMEEMLNMNKIIRPAYESVLTTKKYKKIEDRNA